MQQDGPDCHQVSGLGRASPKRIAAGPASCSPHSKRIGSIPVPSVARSQEEGNEMTINAAVLALLAAWGFLSYSSWRLAAQRGLYGPVVNLCAVLCPLILLLVAMRGQGSGEYAICRTCYRRGCVDHGGNADS